MGNLLLSLAAGLGVGLAIRLGTGFGWAMGSWVPPGTETWTVLTAPR